MINKRCLSSYSKTSPLCVLGTKAKLFDSSFNTDSFLHLCDYNQNLYFKPLAVQSRFTKLIWCTKDMVFSGHENGHINGFRINPSVFVESDNTAAEDFADVSGDLVITDMLDSKDNLSDGITQEYSTNNEKDGDILGMDYNPFKELLCIGSEDGNLSLLPINKTDSFCSSVYKLDRINNLSFNRKINFILCVSSLGIVIIDLRKKKEVLRILKDKQIRNCAFIDDTTLIYTIENKVFKLNLANDSHELISNFTNDANFVFNNPNDIILYDKNDIVWYNNNKIIDKVVVEDLYEVSLNKHNSDFISLGFLKGIVKLTDMRSIFNLSGYTLKETNIIVNLKGYVISNSRGAAAPLKMFKKKKIRSETKSIFWELHGLKDKEELKKVLIAHSKGVEQNNLLWAIVNGDLDQAYEMSLDSNLSIPLFSYLSMVIEKPEYPKELELKLLMILKDANIDYLISEVKLDWILVLIYLCNFDLQLMKTACVKLAGVLKDTEGRLMCYLIGGEYEKYSSIVQNIVEEPTTLFEYDRAIEKYENIFNEIEALGCEGFSKLHKEFLRAKKKVAKVIKETPTSDKKVHEPKISENSNKVPGASPKGSSYQPTVVGTPSYGIPTVPEQSQPNTQRPPFVTSLPGTTPPVQTYGTPRPSIYATAPVQNNVIRNTQDEHRGIGTPFPAMPVNTVTTKTESQSFERKTQPLIPQPSVSSYGLTAQFNNLHISTPDSTATPTSTQRVGTYGDLKAKSPVASPRQFNMPSMSPRMPSQPSYSGEHTVASNRPTGTQPAYTNVPQTPIQRSSSSNVATYGGNMSTTGMPVVSDEQSISGGADMENLIFVIEEKIELLKQKASLKTGMIYRSKTNSALKNLKFYQKQSMTPGIAASVKGFVDVIDFGKNKEQLLAEASFKCDRIVHEYGGQSQIEIWLPAIFTLLQVSLS